MKKKEKNEDEEIEEEQLFAFPLWTFIFDAQISHLSVGERR